jgi:hypothetical protein
MSVSNKFIKWGITFVLLIGLIIIYKIFNPNGNDFFPKCIFHELTGYKCPGCGSQRAIHHLLNFDIATAISENILLVLAIPYIIIGFIFDLIKNPSNKIIKWKKFLFGKKAIILIFVVIILFWVLRNIPVFTDYI